MNKSDMTTVANSPGNFAGLESGPERIYPISVLDQDPRSAPSRPHQSRALLQLQTDIASRVLGLPAPQADKKQKREFDDVWEDYRKPRTRATDLAGLKNLLPHESYGQCPQLQTMVNFLELKNGRHKSLGDLGGLYDRVGPEKAEKVLEILNQYLAKGPVEDRLQLVRNIVHDLALPSSIRQMRKGTCAATAAQTMLAIEQPKRYVELATKLADGETVKLPNGQTLHPNNVWRTDSKDRRTQSAKVLQNAFMKHANGSYDSTKDYERPGKDGEPDKPSPEDGLTRSQQKRLGRDILGYDNYKRWDSGFHSKQKLFQMVEDEIAHGRPAVISLPGHAVTVVGLDKSGEQHTVIINSWGEQHSMTVEEFQKYVQSVRYRDDPDWDNKQTPDGRLTLLGDED